ncbi:MAG: PadR family transcriptional regulator, partial [Thermomicrobiales bacterium]
MAASGAREGNGRGSRRDAAVGRPPRLGPAESALLGLIAGAMRDQADGAGVHGYDLSRRLQTGSLAEIIRLEPGMLYHYLKKLDRAGLVATSVEHQVSRPDRQDHTLTPEGEAALQAWLDAPVRATRDVRLDFLVKLWFARELDPVRAVALVREQRGVIKRLLGSLQEQRAGMALDEDPQAAAQAAAQAAILRDTLDLRIAQTSAVLSWLNTLPENGQ